MSRFSVDFDSVLADIVPAQLRLANSKFNTSYTSKDITTWLWHECLPKHIDDYVWSDQVFQNIEFHSKEMKAVKGAIAGTRALQEMGHELYIVSDRPGKLFEVTRAWLDRRGLKSIPLYFTNKINPTKIDKMHELGLTHVVEDSPGHAENFNNEYQIEKVYLLNTGYNTHVVGDKITRVKNWKEIVQQESFMIV